MTVLLVILAATLIIAAPIALIAGPLFAAVAVATLAGGLLTVELAAPKGDATHR